MKMLNKLSKIFKRPKHSSLKDYPFFYEEMDNKMLAPHTKTNIDIRTFHNIKQELKGNWTRKEIAKFFGISPTTLNLIRTSRSFKQYKLNRRKHSKPEKYT